MLKPVVKWAGGKRQLLPEIHSRLPQINWNQASYFEPFIGGAALLFNIAPERAVINDVNPELINLYRTIKQQPDQLIGALRIHRNEESYYYEVRAWDRDAEAYARLSPVERAARLIFLNRTCYNGLYRVNASGQFNVPFGKYKQPDIVQEETIRDISAYFNRTDIRITEGDFNAAVNGAQAGDFVYFDPPYDVLTKTAAFTSYAKEGFGREEQRRLAEVFRDLSDRGVYVMLSNHATDFILELYADFHIHIVQARRNINSKASARGNVDEVLVLNYELH
ncbi:DNA adenine methylase [Paenibacillus sp. OSY-SE]|uniref:DNA adenine methylase n=1 Tax=Paenibacillus sp. OSY-SE TaxID=1196323 RepID=UPI0003123A26|nr:DNA adenine methylase [Paenibacillus sp. OSY-SE]